MIVNMKHVHDRLHRAIRAKSKSYHKGEISQEEMIEFSTRRELLRTRMKWLESVRERRAKRGRMIGRLAEIRQHIAQGGRLVAYDTEYLQEGPVEQLGVTVYENGEMTTTTYTREGYTKFPPTTSLYGPEVTATVAEMIEVAQDLYQPAAIHIFHTIDVEVEKLKLEKQRAKFIDIAAVGRVFYGKSASPGLFKLCKHYKVDTTGHHSAGNDSRMTMEVLLKMVADPYWASRDWLSASWNERLTGISKMWPTRKPPLTHDELRTLQKAMIRDLRSGKIPV